MTRGIITSPRAISRDGCGSITAWLSWRNVATATEAIRALRAAMPEVVVVQQDHVHVDLEPTGNIVYRLVAG